MNTLKKEFLGVPVYVWLAGLGAFGVATYFFIKQGGSSGAKSADQGNGRAQPVPYPVYQNPTPATPGPVKNPGFPSFDDWLQQAFNGSRPDLLAAIKEGRWQDLAGQYEKEYAAWKAAHNPRPGPEQSPPNDPPPR